MSDQDIINAALAAQAAVKAQINGLPANSPVKQLVSIVDGTPVVTHVKAGPLTFWDQLKKYYKAIIAVIGAIVVITTQLQDVVPDGRAKEIITLITVSLTAIGVAFKQNEHWFVSGDEEAETDSAT